MKQAHALEVMKLGHNVFLTGEPGSGKTYVLNEFIDYCRQHDIELGITASTGIAATHIGGMTIHSWSGAGIHSRMSEDQLDKLRQNGRLLGRLKKTRVLIIDEVSMLEGARFELLNRICKTMRSSDKPFGGLQVILCGDLFQLPPVTNRGEDIDYIYTSPAWEELGLRVCYLSEQHRQNEDKQLLDLLQAVRKREITDDVLELLRGCHTSEATDEEATRLYTHNANVDELNLRRLHRIEAESYHFRMQTNGQEQFIQQLQKSCLAPEELELKVGARVLCVANNPAAGFVNGSRAEVVDFEDGRPVIRLDSGRVLKLDRHTWSVTDGERALAEVSQYPLRLAWAITVHKSQGMSLEQADIDLSRAFTPGMGYVALSRLQTLRGLRLRGLNEVALHVSPEVAEFDRHLQHRSEHTAAQLARMDETELESLHQRIRTNLSTPYAEYDQDLFEHLRQWRSRTADAQGKPAYTVFDDKTLISLAAERPDSLDELLQVPGVGPKKLDSYGQEVLSIIRRARGQLF